MNPEHVLAELNRAKKSLQAAELLLSRGLYEDAVSRGYYAVLHAARASLLLHDAIPESHAAVRRLFGLVLVKPGYIEAKWANILSREQDERIVADYESLVSWEEETASRLVRDARAFVDRIQRYLKGNGVSPQA